LAKLSKVKANTQQKEEGFGEDDIFAEENLAKDFDVEAFFDVKQENLEKGDLFAGANETLMDKYIEMMGSEPMLSPKLGVGPS
jgi:hypothetical protein